jgi:hypothetical protein
MRVMPLHVLGVCYYPVSNRCSSALLPTLPGVELSPYFTKLRVKVCGSTVLVSKGSHLLLIWSTPVSLCFDDRANP